MILAAGRSERLGTVDKLWIRLNGKPLIQWSIEAFDTACEVTAITVVTRQTSFERMNNLVQSLVLTKPCNVIVGGDSRMESVSNACDVIDATYIAIHDGARPLISSERIDAVCAAVRGHACACLSLPVVETLIRKDDELETARVDRTNLYALQTPQVIETSTWKRGKTVADTIGATVTDDTHMATLLKLPVIHVLGQRDNIKITYPEDIEFAEKMMRKDSIVEYRTGFGYDIHRTSEQRKCILGGVHFENSGVGLLGHSDADVLLHAICDALLGATSLGDIGVHFPPSDEKHRDRPSTEFLREVNNLLRQHGWFVGNIDATVIAEAPKIMSRATEMREIIGEILTISIDKVSIKATTNEGLGSLGSGDGIAAHAVTMVYR